MEHKLNTKIVHPVENFALTSVKFSVQLADEAVLGKFGGEDRDMV